MSVSPIDAMLQIATPARPVEPPSRGDVGRAFGPALEQAYKTERPREAAPSPETPPADPADQDDGLSVEDRSASYDRTGEGAEANGEAVEEAAETNADEDAEKESDAEEDEVSISEAASALAKEVKAVVVEPEAQAVLLGIDGAAAAEAVDAEADAAAAEAEAQHGTEKSAHHKSGSANSRTDLPGDAEQQAGSKASGAAKRAKAEASAIEAPEDIAKSSAGEVKAAEEQVVEDGQAGGEEVGSKAGEDTKGGAKDGEPRQMRSSVAEGTERLNITPVEQTAELAAAIERHVAQLDKAGGSESLASEGSAATAVEPTSSSPSPRSAATLDRLAASSLRRTDSANQSEGGPQIDRPRFVQRVEGALRAAQQRDGRVQVRLAPPELGSLRIELAVQNGVMTAKLEAETPAARNALLDNLPALRERLAEQNIRVEKFDVDVRRDPQSSGGNSTAHDRPGDQNDAGGQERRGRTNQPRIPALAAAPRRSAAASTTDATLDVRI